jgi:GT2 family glycosyltransferase
MLKIRSTGVTLLTGFVASLLTRMRAAQPARLTRKVSIGMAAQGNSKTTSEALNMLFASATGEFELILIDDLSPDDTLDVYREAAKRHPNTRVFSFDADLEYCHSVNAFLSHARGDRLLFLSNDIFVNPSYLRQLLEAAGGNPDCGILRGCSNFVDNDSPLHNIPVAGFQTQKAFFAFGAEIACRHHADAFVDERFLVGDAFLVTRPLIERIGTFDTRFFGYCADMDFGLRAQIAGFRVVLVRSAFAVHQEHVNFKYLPPQEQQTKLNLRISRASEALRLFLQKYEIPLQGVNVKAIPWERLARQPFDEARHHFAPQDYSRYLLHA